VCLDHGSSTCKHASADVLFALSDVGLWRGKGEVEVEAGGFIYFGTPLVLVVVAYWNRNSVGDRCRGFIEDNASESEKAFIVEHQISQANFCQNFFVVCKPVYCSHF
jgi:hypothetical protein